MAFEQLTEFDKIVKSALEGVEEAVPSSVWDNIASKLDAIAGAAAAGTAITSVTSGSAASGTVASGTAAGSATTGSVATGAAAGTTATGTAATGAAAGTTATSAAAGTAATGAAAGAAGSAAAGAAAGGAAVAASSNAITIALASVAAAGVIGGGAALVLNNSNNQHIIEEPKPITEVVVDTTSETMPEDTIIDLVQYIRHQRPVIDEEEPVQEATEEAAPEQKEEPEEVAMDRPAPQTEKSEVQWEIQPKKSSPRFAVSAGYLNSIDRTSVDVSLNGFYVGISYNIPINKSFGIAPGLYYSLVWSGPVNRWGGRIFFDDARITEHYLDVPVYANYLHQFNDLYGLRVFAGPTFSTCLASKYEYNDLKCNSFDEMNYTRFDLMLGGGASFEFRQRYTVTAGFDIGLLRRNGEGGKDHMRSKLYFGIGYNF